MKNILVATDLSERSDRALIRAALIARQMNAQLHVVHVVDNQLSPSFAVVCEEHATTALQKQVNSTAIFKDIDTNISVEYGHPWKMITQLADHHKADLTVLGTHRNRGLRDLFVGTTLHRVAKSCRSPLLVAMKPAMHLYSKVIVGVDFSECARHATNLASRISQGHPLTLIHAYHIPFKALTMRADEHGDIITREKKRIESEIRLHMNDFIGTLKNPNKDNHRILKEGGPTKVLQVEATSRKADLVCVGSHSKPWLVEAILGSTAHELLSIPPCDVLVAPLR